jgi:hypothetical protein
MLQLCIITTTTITLSMQFSTTPPFIKIVALLTEENRALITCASWVYDQ